MKNVRPINSIIHGYLNVDVINNGQTWISRRLHQFCLRLLLIQRNRRNEDEHRIKTVCFFVEYMNKKWPRHADENVEAQLLLAEMLAGV